jgi:hypothetical protein
MTKAAFRKCFQRGLGSAIAELQSCGDPSKFFDVVMYGCLHNTTYDIQCEGDRGWYLHQAAKLVKDEAAVEEAVCRKLPRVKDVWLFAQLSSILYHFADNGSETARNALYSRYDSMLDALRRKRRLEKLTGERDMFDWLCVWLTSLDGWGAFKRIAQGVSERLLPKNADFFFSEWFYDNSKGKFGRKRVEGYLRKQSEKSRQIRAYFEKAQEWDNHVYEKPPIPNLDEVISKAAQGQYRGRAAAMLFARNANADDMERLAQAAMNMADAEAQAELLWAFRGEDYAFPESFLIKLSQSDHETLRFIAYSLMGQNPSAKTRELALKMIRGGSDIANAVSLLVKNMKPEDEQLLYNAVKTFPPDLHNNEWHWLYSAAANGVMSLRGKPKTGILEYLYRATLCSGCRCDVVRYMRMKGVLSDTVLNECSLDSNGDIRALAKRLIKSRALRELCL